MGRKHALVADARTLATLRKLGEWNATRDEAAAWLEVSRPTLWKFLNDNPEALEEFEAGLDRGKATLRRLQWKAAQGGNATMLIWLGKQILKQRDDAAGGDSGTKESIEALRRDIESKLARVAEAEPAPSVVGKPKPE